MTPSRAKVRGWGRTRPMECKTAEFVDIRHEATVVDGETTECCFINHCQCTLMPPVKITGVIANPWLYVADDTNDTRLSPSGKRCTSVRWSAGQDIRPSAGTAKRKGHECGVTNSCVYCEQHRAEGTQVFGWDALKRVLKDFEDNPPGYHIVMTDQQVRECHLLRNRCTLRRPPCQPLPPLLSRPSP